MPFNLPNLLTLARIAAIPVLVVLFYAGFHMQWAWPASSMVFVAASVTDWLDGYLARRMQLVSPFGAFLDPVADKLMVATALILLVEADPRSLMTLSAVVIVGREITISALREWMAGQASGARIAVSWTGKVKTALQMTAIPFLLWRHPIGSWQVYEIGVVLLYLAAALTLWSMFRYLQAAWPQLTRHG